MTWTKEQPTQAGWYWYRRPISRHSKWGKLPAVVEVTPDLLACGWCHVANLDWQWAGPIPEPEDGEEP